MNMANKDHNGNRAGREKSAALRFQHPRWWAAVFVSLLLPKCVACIAGYIAFATGVIVTPELCGVTEGTEALTAGQLGGISITMISLIWLFRAGRKLSEIRPNVR
jgi:hypothetical protein